MIAKCKCGGFDCDIGKYCWDYTVSSTTVAVCSPSAKPIPCLDGKVTPVPKDSKYLFQTCVCGTENACTLGTTCDAKAKKGAADACKCVPSDTQFCLHSKSLAGDNLPYAYQFGDCLAVMGSYQKTSCAATGSGVEISRFSDKDCKTKAGETIPVLSECVKDDAGDCTYVTSTCFDGKKYTTSAAADAASSPAAPSPAPTPDLSAAASTVVSGFALATAVAAML
jgi:hypothetical protein